MFEYESIWQTKTYWYAYNVVYGEIIACIDVKNACKRFLNDLERAENDPNFEFYFDLEQCNRIENVAACLKFTSGSKYFDLEQCNRIENVAACLKFTSGSKAGQQIDLAPPQTFVLDNIYAWRYKSNPRKRRFRTAMVMKSRKNAKTFDLSFVSNLAMLDEPEAEVYSVASKKDQAMLSFRQCRSMIASNPRVAKKFKLNRSEIILKTNGSTFKYLASEEKTLDGISPSVGIIDEAFVVPEGVRSSIASGTGARLSPLIVAISTSYDVKMTGNWAFEEMEYTKKVNSGELENERHFGVIYQLDSEDEVDDEKMWEKANPLLPYSETLLDSLREDYKKAVVNSALMRNFKIKNMNLILDGKGLNKYLSIAAFELLQQNDIDFKGKYLFFGLDLSMTTDLCAVSICAYNEVNDTFDFYAFELLQQNDIDFKGKYLFFGLDLSMTTDLCAVSICAYNEVNDTFDFYVHPFLPKENIRELEISDGIPYRRYADEGHITLIDGPVIEHETVYQWCKEFALMSQAHIAMIAYDPYNSDYIMERCKEEGITTLHIMQGYRMLSGPTKKFREYVYSRRIRYVHNPIFNWCVTNAVTAKDKFKNEILDKEKSPEKIDLLAASIFSFLACDKNKEYYYSRGYEDYLI